MKKNEDIKNIKFGLFQKGSSLKTYIRDIFLYIGRIFFIIKHGYSPVMNWEFFSWHRAVCEEFFNHNLKERYGSPILSAYGHNVQSITGEHEAWDEVVKEMLNYLSLMDENNEVYNEKSILEADKSLEENKDKFFALFSKYYYDLWD